MDQRKVVFYLKDKSYERVFEIDYIINTFPQNVRNAFLNGSYHVNADVSEEVLLSYLNFMKDHRNMPEIDFDNICYLHQLDNEFHLLSNTFQNNEYQQLLKLAYLSKIAFNRSLDTSKYEKFVAQNLDYYIENFPDDISNIDIKMLNNIFSHPDRVLTNHEAAYRFITQIISKNQQNANKLNYCILLSYLQCSKLSLDSILDSFENKKERLGFIPELDFSMNEVTDGTISFLRIQLNDKNGLIQNSLSNDEKEQQLVNKELNKLRMKIYIDKLNFITQIEFPNFLRAIPSDFCKGLKNLQKVIIPLSTHTICEGAFRDCISLKEIILPPTLIEIHDNAFRGCRNLKELSLPSSVSIIGKFCFSYCSSLCCITIPPSVMLISDYLFDHCTSLIEINLPSGIKRIGEHAFENCDLLQSFEFPDALESIGKGAFSFCGSILQVEVPSSVAVIEENAFGGCKTLTKVKIPPSVKSIGPRVFQGCRLLSQIENISSISSIEDSTFYECLNLAVIELPFSVTTIEKNAFCSLVNLKEICLPSSVVFIGDNAFRNCSSLQTIELSSTLKIIGNRAFFHCVNLVNINFPKSLEYVGDSAFKECMNLLKVEIPSTAQIQLNSFPQKTQIQKI